MLILWCVVVAQRPFMLSKVFPAVSLIEPTQAGNPSVPEIIICYLVALDHSLCLQIIVLRLKK